MRANLHMCKQNMATSLSKRSNSQTSCDRTPFGDEVSVDLDNMTLEEFKLWSMSALKVFLYVRKKSTMGSFDELAAR